MSGVSSTIKGWGKRFAAWCKSASHFNGFGGAFNHRVHAADEVLQCVEGSQAVSNLSSQLSPLPIDNNHSLREQIGKLKDRVEMALHRLRWKVSSHVGDVPHPSDQLRLRAVEVVSKEIQGGETYSRSAVAKLLKERRKQTHASGAELS